MGRAIVVMVSTLLFGIFGLFVAWLNVQAVLSDPNFRRTELITMSYAFGSAFRSPSSRCGFLRRSERFLSESARYAA
jgi:hypothetical protein